jgi:hypothetical protein
MQNSEQIRRNKKKKKKKNNKAKLRPALYVRTNAGKSSNAMPWEMKDCPWRAASWRHYCTGTGYSSTVLFWLFREINGDKVATNTHWFLTARS